LLTLPFHGLLPPKHRINLLAVSDRSDPIRVVLPFKDQASAGIVRAQLKELNTERSYKRQGHATFEALFLCNGGKPKQRPDRSRGERALSSFKQRSYYVV